MTTNVPRMTTAQTASADLAEVIVEAMKADGQSQRSMSTATGIPLVTLNRRLTGRSAFTVIEVAAIAQVLDISVVDLFLRAERRALKPAV